MIQNRVVICSLRTSSPFYWKTSTIIPPFLTANSTVTAQVQKRVKKTIIQRNRKALRCLIQGLITSLRKDNQKKKNKLRKRKAKTVLYPTPMLSSKMKMIFKSAKPN
jgi:hypothetical protein